jgi:hypothetical protein
LFGWHPSTFGGVKRLSVKKSRVQVNNFRYLEVKHNNIRRIKLGLKVFVSQSLLLNFLLQISKGWEE